MMKYIEEERVVVATDKEALSNNLKEKENEILKHLAELHQTKERFRQWPSDPPI